MKFYIPIKFDDIKIGDGLLVHFVDNLQYKDRSQLNLVTNKSETQMELLILYDTHMPQWTYRKEVFKKNEEWHQTEVI